MFSVLAKFLADFGKEGNKIIIQTYYPEGSVVSFSGALTTTASSEYSATYHFASILEVWILFFLEGVYLRLESW